MVKVSIVVVSYNTRELTLGCLNSVYEQTVSESFEVIVVDNGSFDGSADAVELRFPRVRLIRSEENLGFARANNLAARLAGGEFLLLLNPDTVVVNHAIDRLLSFGELERGQKIVGGRTLFGDGGLNLSSCWRAPSICGMASVALGLNSLFPKFAPFNPDYMLGWDRTGQRDVDIVSGCFFMISRKNWELLGGFDPEFFMYGEEFDLCLRARKLGIQCRITGDATIIHYGGASEPLRADKLVKLLKTKKALIRKHWPAGRCWVGERLLGMWPLNRVVLLSGLSLVSRRFRPQAAVWREVFRRRREWCAELGR